MMNDTFLQGLETMVEPPAPARDLEVAHSDPSTGGGLLGGMTTGGFVEEVASAWASSLPRAGPRSLLFIT